MKTFAFTIVLIMMSLSLAAQDVFQMGPKVGINYSKLIFDETFTSDGVDFTYVTQDADVGIVAGAFVRLNIRKFFLQPEALFSKDQSTVKVSSIGLEEFVQVDINKVDFPILIGWKPSSPVRIYAGPVVTIVTNANANMTLIDKLQTFHASYDDKTFGYTVGIGFDFWRFTTDLRYEGNLTKLGMQYQIGNQTINFDHRKNVLQATIGFMLIK